MTQYIDKSALITEIERIQNTTMDKNKNFTSSYDEGMFHALTLLENYIDTLEVKEVDLEKEFDKCCENYIFDDECEVYTAKRFFKLGFKVQNGE